MPTEWSQLNQEQLRHVVRLIWLYAETPDWENRVSTAAFLYFARLEVAKRLPEGWLCREQTSGKTFLFAPDLLPACVQSVSFICQVEQMTDRIEIDETENASINLRFPPAQRSGDVVFKATGITVGYPQKVVFSNADIEIKRGEKVALIGRNGEGKTTLMRVIMKELYPLEGEAKTGHNVSIGYYAQNQEDILDPSETVFGTLDRIAVGDIRTRLRDILGAFLFKGEDIDKRVSVLSGGERARLGMAKLMLSPYNVLALDEPTNHMDIRSKDILKQALKSFDGTLIVVSHDRDFLDGLVDKLYEFRDGKVTEHLGTVADFLRRRKLESLQELERKAPVQEKAPARASEGEKEFRKMKAVSKEERKIRNRIDYLEKQISAHEAKMAEIEKILANPGNNDDILDLTRDYLEHKRTVDEETLEWTSLMEQIENQ